MSEEIKDLKEQIADHKRAFKDVQLSLEANFKRINELKELTSNIDGPIKSDTLLSHILNMKKFNSETNLRLRNLKTILRELIEEGYALIHGLMNQRADIGLKKDSCLWAIINGFATKLDNLNRKLDSGKRTEK